MTAILQDPEKTLSKFSHKIFHWALAGSNIKLEKIEDCKYLIRLLKNGEEQISHSNFSLQIHFDTKENLIGLFVKCDEKGWFIETLDIFDEDDVKQLIVRLVSSNLKMIKDIETKFLEGFYK